MPQQGQVVGGQAGVVAAQLAGQPGHVVAVVVAGQRRGLVGDPVPRQQEHGQGERVLRGVRGRPGAQGDVETADPRQGLPPESHVRPDPERRQRVERALRAMARERGRRETAALAVAAELLEQLLGGSVQAGRQDHAADAADIRSTREAAGQPGQPVPVGFLIIIEERDDVAGRRRDPGVARPRQPGTRFVHAPEDRRSRVLGIDQFRDPARARRVVYDHDLEAGVLLLTEQAQAVLQLVRAVPGAHHDADERGAGQHGPAAPQERPAGRVGRQASPGQPPGCGEPGRFEPVRDRRPEIFPEQRSQLVRGKVPSFESDDARPHRLGMQPAGHPGAPVPGGRQGRQRGGQFHVHHESGPEPPGRLGRGLEGRCRYRG